MGRDGFAVQTAVAKKKPLPEWATAEFEVLPCDEFYIQAFNDLSTCRNFGFGPGPIPWKDIVSYADRAGLDEDLVPGFVTIIRALDNAWLGWEAKKKEKPEEKPERRPAKKRPPVPSRIKVSKPRRSR